jgi:hypothetical protein
VPPAGATWMQVTLRDLRDVVKAEDGGDPAQDGTSIITVLHVSG